MSDIKDADRSTQDNHRVRAADDAADLDVVRIGVGRALRGAVTAQLLLAITDVGKILSNSGATFDMPTLIGIIVFLTILGLILMKLAEVVERRILAWRHAA